MGVSTSPGVRQFTRILKGAHSKASDSLQFTIAALTAEYAEVSATGRTPKVELTFSPRLGAPARRCAKNARVRRPADIRLLSNWRCQIASDVSINAKRSNTPALLTKPSRGSPWLESHRRIARAAPE